jgi:hypothetical protein
MLRVCSKDQTVISAMLRRNTTGVNAIITEWADVWCDAETHCILYIRAGLTPQAFYNLVSGQGWVLLSNFQQPSGESTIPSDQPIWYLLHFCPVPADERHGKKLLHAPLGWNPCPSDALAALLMNPDHAVLAIYLSIAFGAVSLRARTVKGDRSLRNKS